MATTPQSPWQTPGYSDQLGINRQREMAKLLLAQGQNQPQGQMVSGRYVAPSFAQYLAPAVSTYLGQNKQEKADAAEKALAERLQKQNTESFAQYGKLMSGDQGVAAVQGPTQGGDNLSNTVTPQAPVAPDRGGAINYALQSNNPELRAIALEKIKGGQKLGEGEVFQEFNLGTGKFETTAQGGEKYKAPLTTDLGSHVEYRDPRDPTKILAKVQKGVGPEAAARLADEGIGYGGGGGSRGGGVTTTGGGVAPAAPAMAGGGAAPGAPAAPQIGQPPPGLSPKQTREWTKEQYDKQTKKSESATGIYKGTAEAARILNAGNVHESGIGNIYGGIKQWTNLGSQSANANDASLKAIGASLTMAQPRMEGPQSDADARRYAEASGNVGDATIPIEARKAALLTVVRLQQQYAPSLQWDELAKQLEKPEAAPVPASRSFDQLRKSAPATQAAPPAPTERGLTPENRKRWGL